MSALPGAATPALVALDRTLDSIWESMALPIREFVARGQELEFATPCGDGGWGAIVKPDLSVQFTGYALEGRGPSGHLEDLAHWELGHLLDVLRRRITRQKA